MSRIKLLLDVVNDMRSLADSIQAACDAIVSDEPTEMSQAEAPAAVLEKPPKKPEKGEALKQPEITLEQVRGVLADKSRSGKTAEVRAIIQKYGADRLSGIDPKKDAALALGLTRTSITRASEQLKALGLITEETCWKEIRMTACVEGKQFYDAGKQYLISPILKKLTLKSSKSLNWLYAGESALGKRTMLNEPEIPTVAIDKKQLSKASLTELDEKWETEKDLLHVEIWKYDPALFAEARIVDPVSMAVSLKDCMDERVQGELEEFMEEYQW